MKSMTGYGRATVALGMHTLTVQVSSVNRKTLDLAVRLPAAWESLEPDVNELVRKVAQRGRVTVNFELTGTHKGGQLAWDEAEISLALDRLASLAKTRGVEFKPTPELLWSVAATLRQPEELPASDEVAPAVTKVLAEALRSFVDMRAKEGEALLLDFSSRLELLRRQVEVIATRAPVVPATHRDLLLQRLRQAELQLDLHDERVLKEIALFADRCDVSEELTRLDSHFEQFALLLRAEGEVGRKGEFLLQEIGREVNTIGSKANDLTISRAVMELKNELERIREQMANVE
jgi:uncharacterized protein (TIGR00255 family)